MATIADYAPGKTVTLTVNRGGQTKSIKLTLGSQPASAGTTQSQGGLEHPVAARASVGPG